MTSHRVHSMPLEFYVGDKPVPLEAVISFDIKPEWPASHDDPGAPAEVDITDITFFLAGKIVQCPWLEPLIHNSPEVIEELREAGDRGRPYRDPDTARDERRDRL